MKILDELKEELDQERIYLRKARQLMEAALEDEWEAASNASFLQEEIEGYEVSILRLEGKITDIEEANDDS